MKKKLTDKLVLICPVVALLLSTCMKNLPLILLSLAALYAGISISSLSRKQEGLWLFVLTGIATIPVNILLSLRVCEVSEYMWSELLLSKLLFFPLSYAVLLSFEEITLGLLGRIIWRDRDPSWKEE
ncbi:MAG: hypothetical protein K6E50_01225 [Lachnospiraceae bacterium]|nr:hypothetical protein [Lachnospiraceae bacterium]